MDFKNSFTAKNISFSLLILFIFFCIVKMPDIALLLFVGYVISCAINPVVNKLSEKMSRTLATSIMLTVVIAATLGLFIPIIVMAVKEIKEFITQLPGQIDNIQMYLDSVKIGKQSLSQLFNLDAGLANSGQIAQEIIDKSINFTVGALGVITILVTVAIIVFFFTNDRERIKNSTLRLLPASLREDASRIIDDLEQKVGGYVTAQFLSITQVGVCVAVGLAILHVNYAVFLGFISAVMDLVPVVGPVISGVVILLVAISHGPVIAALAIGVLLLAQFIENNWAKPYFFSKYMDLHPLIVIFSFVLAAKLIGVIGVVFAPAIAAVIVTLFDEIYVKIMNEDGKN